MRLLLISNRLPVTIKRENKTLSYEPSVGGLVTGIRDFLEYNKKNTKKKSITNYLWAGWPGATINNSEHESVQKELLKKFNSFPVFLPEKQMDKFYLGFCNKTLWPLFHYFTTLTTYDDNFWDSYKEVNETFFKSIENIIKEDDIIWIHDYHLMLLPELIRKKCPNCKIGFFLHIPFPSYEVYRLLPKVWREKILQGLLGADLLGFHTPDYTQHFIHCVQRILGFEYDLGKIFVEKRLVKANTFPMGINFDKFFKAGNEPVVKTEMKNLKKSINAQKIVVSIDRLDYTKGILNRLYGYERFLESHPEWIGKVVFILIVVPSRTGIDQYKMTKKQVDEYVGKINGRFGNVKWSPISYQYNSFTFNSLAAIYKISDVALITPLRDGMNLVAKEYIASRSNQTGVLILSEMAGAAKELGEALIINPNSIEEISESLSTALSMPKKEQIEHMKTMQERLKSYNVIRWTENFLEELQQIYEEKNKLRSKVMSNTAKDRLKNLFQKTKQKILFLDYDGTLAPLAKLPALAKPTNECIKIISNLAKIKNLDLVIISGRDKKTLEEWFPIKNIHFVVEHGAWIKRANNKWQTLKQLSNEWKTQIINLLKMYSDRVPGTFVEEKDYSVCWHYRNADQDFAAEKIKELMDDLVSLTANSDLQVMPGNKIIEVKIAGINKGIAALQFLSKKKYDFILAAGDDATDEDLFQAMPEGSHTIKIGVENSHAKYNLFDSSEFLELLKNLKG